MSAPDIVRPPELTVVIPAHNEERFLGDQLSALADQHWPDGQWEIVLVDNQSDDGTVEVARGFAHCFDRLRIVTANDRTSLSYARNSGIAAAGADHIAICDADDIVGPGWVAAMGNALRLNRFVTGRLEVDRLNPRWLADSRGRGGESGPRLFAGYFPAASGGNLGLHRTLWEEIGGFAEGAEGAEDMLFSMEAWLRGVPLHYSPDAILHYRYRFDAGSLWRQGRTYGRSRTLVCKELRQAGFSPSRFAGWRSWVWIAVNLPHIGRPAERLNWIWVVANRLGHLEGSIRHRTISL